MEQIPHRIEKDTLLALLKERGIEDKEVESMVLEWTIQREQLVTTPKEAILFNIERSELYIATGDIEGAIDVLNDALLQAHNENEVVLFSEIKKKLSDLEG